MDAYRPPPAAGQAVPLIGTSLYFYNPIISNYIKHKKGVVDILSCDKPACRQTGLRRVNLLESCGDAVYRQKYRYGQKTYAYA